MSRLDQDSDGPQPILVVGGPSPGMNNVQVIVREAGFEVVGTGTGEEALEVFQRAQPGAVILDLTLPGISGFEVCAHLRSKTDQVPILILSRHSEDEHKMRGFELGADDYLVKPFHPGELVARIRALLRRCWAPARTILGSGGIQFDPMTLKCRKGAMEIDLTPKEARLLSAFLRNPGKVLSRDHLVRMTWGEEHYGSAKGLDMHIRRLREKIEDDPSRPRHLVTAWGAGYLWK